MKKTPKKLDLNVATIRVLKQDDLVKVNGGEIPESRACGGSRSSVVC